MSEDSNSHPLSNGNPADKSMSSHEFLGDTPEEDMSKISDGEIIKISDVEFSNAEAWTDNSI